MQTVVMLLLQIGVLVLFGWCVYVCFTQGGAPGSEDAPGPGARSGGAQGGEIEPGK